MLSIFCSAYQNLYSWSWVFPSSWASKKRKKWKEPKNGPIPWETQEHCNTKGEKMSQELVLEAAVFNLHAAMSTSHGKTLVWILFWAGQVEPKRLRLYTTTTFRNKHDLMFVYIKHNIQCHIYKKVSFI